ncbi:MAG: bacterioferritin [Methylotetracoccus sp.]|nr:bacterioferritin [Methylotetracoccus sp.]
MQGHPKVIAYLNDLLAGELTAIDQYFIHSRMLRDWGYSKLFDRIDHEMHEEQAHGDALIRRILFLDGMPDLGRREALNVGRSVPEMFRNDLAVEYRVVDHLREVIAFCESVRDYDTRQILLPLLRDTEEDHAYWLETQLGLIEKIGLPNYLQAQL